ncbi:amidophosphoribosyltransferase [Bdellovibrio sp. SKB1291214]|uniref:amidophosphoribosyltransferase n=1 Tax=Bdellovibrio sp. SKB1291214 TaxID=1732569 RepID=UPI00224047C5|nr:amidophosphoribosyltransferase [Bdellovibrio sp. SKB1291214]UYL08442.1 amidophosphoribosyltransferase [Bdellovibrio sp. SKB1291214]
MCGVVGLIGEDKAGEKLFPALFALQHRGQDAAGILSFDFSRGEFHLEKDLGLVSQVFPMDKLEKIKGSMALGHTRYSTIGTVEKADLQPLIVSYPNGIGMAHNGNVTNYNEIVEYVRKRRSRWTFTRNDLELLLHMMSIGVSDQLEAGKELSPEILGKAAQQVVEKVQGAYSVVGMMADEGMFAFNDTQGIRPLLIGRKSIGDKYSYCFASEKQVFFALGFEYFRDLKPGEFVFVDKDQNFHSYPMAEKKARPCMFEWIYFAGAETEWHGRPVYDVRLRLGEVLANETRRKMQEQGIEIDVVAPVPDTSRAAALRLAEVLHTPYREVLIKNRYVQRSFIVNEPEVRKAMVNLKLMPVESEIRGKSILLVDDSIVRGTTSARIIQLLRESGAKKVYLASTCPPIRNPCFYGIDFPEGEALVAHKRTEDQVAELLGVDGLIYLPLTQLLDGDYPVPVSKEDFINARTHNIGGGGKNEVNV